MCWKTSFAIPDEGGQHLAGRMRNVVRNWQDQTEDSAGVWLVALAACERPRSSSPTSAFLITHRAGSAPFSPLKLDPTARRADQRGVHAIDRAGDNLYVGGAEPPERSQVSSPKHREHDEHDEGRDKRAFQQPQR